MKLPVVGLLLLLWVMVGCNTEEEKVPAKVMPSRDINLQRYHSKSNLDLLLMDDGMIIMHDYFIQRAGKDSIQGGTR